MIETNVKKFNPPWLDTYLLHYTNQTATATINSILSDQLLANIQYPLCCLFSSTPTAFHLLHNACGFTKTHIPFCPAWDPTKVMFNICKLAAIAINLINIYPFSCGNKICTAIRIRIRTGIKTKSNANNIFTLTSFVCLFIFFFFCICGLMSVANRSCRWRWGGRPVHTGGKQLKHIVNNKIV